MKVRINKQFKATELKTELRLLEADIQGKYTKIEFKTQQEILFLRQVKRLSATYAANGLKIGHEALSW